MTMRKRKSISIFRSISPLVWLLSAFSCSTVQAMQALADRDLAEVTGQALFVSDRIAPTGAAGSVTDFTFHRMGLDVELAMNANIDKLQLGCGGFNESIASNACDIDFDFVRFMGRNGTSGGAPVTSDFKLTRPYIELAIRNENSLTQREVAGIKIGAQSADGFIGIGRKYANGVVNQENGGTCGTAAGDSALNCHSGINRISGFLGVELSATVPIDITLIGEALTCFGNTTTNTADPCGPGETFTDEITGTRLNEIFIPAIPLEIRENFLVEALSGGDGFATVQQNLRFIHGFALEDSKDFSLSFQRERIAFPNFDKTGFAAVANVGWWMNVPDVKVMNIQAPTIELGILEALDALSAPGPTLTNNELGQAPPTNCFGGLQFC